MDKVLPVVPPGAFPGVTSVFKNLRDSGLCADFESEPFYQKGMLPGWTSAPDGAVLLFGAWHPGYSNLLRRKGLKKYVLWTSAPLQTEMAGSEVETLNGLLGKVDRGLLDGLLFGDARMARAFPPHPWFPYPIAGQIGVPCAPFEEREAAVSLFVPQHPRKNIFAQFLAVRECQRRRGLPAEVLTNCVPPVPVAGARQAPWIARGAYLETLSRARLNMHVTVTESFGYQVVDALQQGVPSMVSETVARNLFGYPSGPGQNEVAGGVVQDFEDSIEMATVLDEFIDEPERLRVLLGAQRAALAMTASVHEAQLKILLQRLLDAP